MNIPTSLNRTQEYGFLSKPYQIKTQRDRGLRLGPAWVELPFWGGLLVVVFLANIGLLEFSTPTLTAFFFVAAGGIVLSKWFLGTQNLKDMRNFIYGGVLFWVLLDPLQLREGIDEFRYEVVTKALFCVAIFLATASLGYLFPPLRNLDSRFSRISEPRSGTQVFVATVLLYLIGVVPVLYYSGGSLNTFLHVLLSGYNWEVDPGWRRGALGSDLDYLFTIFFLILAVSPFLAVWALKKTAQNILQKAALVWIILSVPTFYFFSGSRRLFAFFVLGVLLYLYNAIRIRKRWRWRVLFAVAPILLLLAMQVQVEYRAAGFEEVDLATVETRLDSLHRDNIFHWLLTATDVMPDKYEFTGDIPFVDLFLHPIPRFLWPGKPVNSGFPFITWEDVGASLTISVMGEFFVAQGLLGVIIAGLAYGFAARNWDQIIQTAPDGSVRILIYYMGGVLFFVVGIRSFQEIVAQWYSVGFLVLVVYFLGRSKNRARIQRRQG